jgi:hypothetical protein
MQYDRTSSLYESVLNMAVAKRFSRLSFVHALAAGQLHTRHSG